MADIIFRFPSKVPYGYVEVRGTPEELSISGSLDPKLIADSYINHFKAYRDAEEKALTFQPPILKAKPAITKPVDEVLSEGDAVDLVVKELGGVPVPDDDDADAPWNNKPEPSKKDYAPADDSAWDFG